MSRYTIPQLYQMQFNPSPENQIEQMIKRKISITNGINFNKNKAFSSCHNRAKSSYKPQKPLQKKHKNDIVIMNMPPSNRIDFLDKETDQVPRKYLPNNQQQSRTPFFTNPHISSEIQRFQSYMFCESNLNKQNCYNSLNNVPQIKKYNSVNIRFSYDGKSSHNTGIKGMNYDQNTQKRKGSVPLIEFKPSFRELLKRNTKSPSKIQIKLKKSQFNYQRAISTSSESRKKAFLKILNAFEQNCIKKVGQNPEVLKSKQIQEGNPMIEKEKLARQLISRVRTSRKSPQVKQRKHKEEESCRPWSAGKRNQIKLQPTQEQNPLQFYSINAKY